MSPRNEGRPLAEANGRRPFCRQSPGTLGRSSSGCSEQLGQGSKDSPKRGETGTVPGTSTGTGATAWPWR